MTPEETVFSVSRAFFTTPEAFGKTLLDLFKISFK